jgi:hypothetical protein
VLGIQLILPTWEFQWKMYLQLLNVPLWIVVTRGGILILEKVQELNAYSPMLSTPSDKLMDDIFA